MSAYLERPGDLEAARARLGDVDLKLESDLATLAPAALDLIAGDLEEARPRMGVVAFVTGGFVARKAPKTSKLRLKPVIMSPAVTPPMMLTQPARSSPIREEGCRAQRMTAGQNGRTAAVQSSVTTSTRPTASQTVAYSLSGTHRGRA